MPTFPNLATCQKIGFIVPSSNTAVEPITQAIFQSLHSNIICIFTRIEVKTVGTDANSTNQFTTETMVAAARLLADAEPDAIVWNGTSGMWVGSGLEADQQLAKAMEDATGVPCTTTTLATVEALTLFDVKTIGIAVPYNKDLAKKVEDFFSALGQPYVVSATCHMDPAPASNLEIARSSLHNVRSTIQEAATSGRSKPEAVVVACTNWPAAELVDDLEQELDVIILDSVLVSIWMGLRLAKSKGQVRGWGRLMRDFLE